MAKKELLWSKEETALLRKIYYDSTSTQLCAAFPNRSISAIRKKARKSGLYVPKEIEYQNRSNAKRGVLRKDGCKYSAKGYRYILRRGHNRADSAGYVAEHIFVWEKETGFPVPENCVIHHLNGNKTDNRIENLCLMSRGAHTVFHCTGRHASEETKRKISEKAKARNKAIKETRVC